MTTDPNKLKSIRISPVDAVYSGVIVVLCILVIKTFIGEYALDDSYIGYDNAQNLASGHGFAFNPDHRVLTTSAPLAVFLYAGISLLNHSDIVSIAQVFAALACLVIGLGGYALVRRFTSPPGALVAAAILVGSPYTLLLWSHEAYLCLAMLIIGLLLFEEGHVVGSAVWVGLAALMRPEAVLAIPIYGARLWMTSTKRRSLLYAVIAATPLVLWSAFALIYFGSATSQSIAAKHAELGFNTVGPYLHGIVALPAQVYALGFFLIIPHLLWISTLVVWIAAAVTGTIRPVHWVVLAWAVLDTAVYVVVRVPFFIWFAMQIGVVLALTAALAWSRDGDSPQHPQSAVKIAVTQIGRLASVIVAGINVLFLLVVTTQPYRMLTFSGTLVMPLTDISAYRQLGEWLTTHTSPTDSVAYPEIGQLRYYSGREIVDFEGLVNRGVPEHVALGDTIWAFKEYRPTVYVDNPSWYPFVNPLEYDWFRRAYHPTDHLKFAMFPFGFDFEIYRLTNPIAVPPADTLDPATSASARMLPPPQGVSIQLHAQPVGHG